MSTEQPRQRLVSRSRYLANVSKKIGTRTLSGILWSSGMLFIGLTLVELGYCAGLFGNGSRADVLVMTVICLCTSSAAVSCFQNSADQRRKSCAIEAGEPITRHNVHLLPPEESLVRGSDRPVTDPQTVLLRAARPGPAMQTDQLLRVAQRKGPDV